MELSRRPPDSTLDLFLLGFFLVVLELLGSFAFLLLLPRLLDFLELFSRLSDGDLGSELDLSCLTAETLCCLPPEAIDVDLTAIPGGVASAVFAVAAFSSDGGPGGAV